MAFEANFPHRQQRPEKYWALVADLVSLIQRTRTLERGSAFGRPGDRGQPSDDGFVIDDVTPDAAAINDCNLRLREALHFLLEARASEKQRLKAAAAAAVDNPEPQPQPVPTPAAP